MVKYFCIVKVAKTPSQKVKAFCIMVVNLSKVRKKLHGQRSIILLLLLLNLQSQSYRILLMGA